MNAVLKAHRSLLGKLAFSELFCNADFAYGASWANFRTLGAFELTMRDVEMHHWCPKFFNTTFF